MTRLLHSRRTFLGFCCVVALLILGLTNKVDVSGALMTIALGVCASNASEKIFVRRQIEENVK